MKFFVYTKAGAKQEKVIQIDENHFIIWTKEPAKEEKANKDVEKILAKHLKIPSSLLRLIKGRHFREKTFEIA